MMHNARDGFALPIALLVIGLIALGIAMSMPSGLQLGRDIRQANARLALQRAAISAESRIKYMLLTEPVGLRGLEVDGPKLAADGNLISGEPENRRGALIFDGRPYAIDLGKGAEVVVRVQDEAGLVNVNVANQDLVTNLLSACGFEKAKARELAVRLIDYRQARRVGMIGAQPIQDIRKVPQWRQILSDDRGRALSSVISTASPTASLNLQLAPKAVLMAAFAGNARLAEKYAAERSSGFFATKMNVYNKQIEYINNNNESNGGNVGATIRLYIHWSSSKLTPRLPEYSYETAINIDMTDSMDLFMPNGAYFNAGNGAWCHKSTGEAVKQLPFPRSAGN
jgi:type II secretory pathway component PulK